MAGRLPGSGQLQRRVSLKKRVASISRRSIRSRNSTTPGVGGTKLQPPLEITFDSPLSGTPERSSKDLSQGGDIVVRPLARHELPLAAGGFGLAKKRGVRLPTAPNHDGLGSQIGPSSLGLGACRMIVAVICFLVGFGLLFMRTAPASHFLLRHSAYDRLVIRNTTTGFHTNGDLEVLEGSYKSWYFFNVNFDWNQGFRGNPIFSTVGPYTVQQYIKTLDVMFSDDVAYKSTAIYGKFLPEYSCSNCKLDDKVTILNEMYMQMLAFYQFDELQVLRQFVPEVVTRYIIETAAYFVQQNMSAPGKPAKDLAIQQFADCSPLKGSSIRDAKNTTFFSKVYVPEFCAWSQTWTKKGNPALYMTFGRANQFLYGADYALLSQGSGFVLAVQNIISRCNPSEGVLLELPGFTFEMSIAIIEYLDYVAQGLGKEVFDVRIKYRFAGMFMTRTVNEILYGYHDPWLKYKFGDNVTNSSTFVTQIYNFNTIDDSLDNIATKGAYTGINTGEYNVSKLYWITQQAMLSDAPLNLVTSTALLADEIQWQYGVVDVESSSGAVFGRVQPEGNLTMWLSPWLRHVNLEYIGLGSQHDLKTYKYRMADSSLAACPDPFPEYVVEDGIKNVDGEGPCLYPNQMQGITDMTLFQGGSMESFPLFYRADPRAIETWGEQSLKLSTLIPDDFEFRMDVEPYFGVSVNISFWIQKLYWVRPSPLIYPLMDVGDGILFPVSYYHVKTEANETVCKALSAGAWTLSAIGFLITTVLPLVGVSCVMCGVHIIWRKRTLVHCPLICIEGDPELEAHQEMVTAHLVIQSRQFMEDEARQEATRTAELRWRHFSEQLGDHDAHYLEIKKYCDMHPIAVKPKRVTQSNSSDIQRVVKKVGKDIGLEAKEIYSEVETSEKHGDVTSAAWNDLRSQSSIKPESREIATHRRGGSRSLSLVEVENAGLAAQDTAARRKSLRLESLKEDEEKSMQRTRFESLKEDEERPLQRTQRLSSRAKSFVVVEEGRTLIDLVKARKAGIATIGSRTSMDAIPEPVEVSNVVSEDSNS